MSGRSPVMPGEPSEPRAPGGNAGCGGIHGPCQLMATPRAERDWGLLGRRLCARLGFGQRWSG